MFGSRLFPSTCSAKCPSATLAGLLATAMLHGVGCDTESAKADEAAAPRIIDTADSGFASLPTDADGDGHASPADCDDTDASIHPGAVETCNERDDNCDGAVDEGVQSTFYTDEDGDGYGAAERPVAACAATTGITADDTDCNDSDAAVHPDAVDICNGADDDCDGDIDEDGTVELYADADGDGWGDDGTRATGCPEPGWATTSGDCDDTDPTAHPGVVADYCDGVNNDCDDEIDEDSKAGWSLMSVNTGDGNVYDIDPSTATITSLSAVSTDMRINSMDVSENGLAFVHISSEKQLGLFDACTGTATPLNEHDAGSIGGISFGPGGRLFGIGGGEDTLWEFDLSTGEATAVGPLGIDIGSSGMAWDCSRQKMYGADTFADIVFEIDLVTGEATNVQTTDVPFSSVGLEYDRASGLLLASSGTSLYTVNPTTGATTEIGPFGASNMDDLAWHPTCP